MILKWTEFLIGVAILVSGACMYYYNHRARQNISPELDKSNLPLSGHVKDEDYSSLGRAYRTKARRWQYTMWVIAVLGGIIIVMLNELLN